MKLKQKEAWHMQGCLRRWASRIFMQSQKNEWDYSENNYKWSLTSVVLLPVDTKG